MKVAVILLISLFLAGCSDNQELQYPAGRMDFVMSYFQTNEVFDLVANGSHGYYFVAFPKDGSIWFVEIRSSGIYRKTKIKSGTKDENANRVTSSQTPLP